MQLYLIRHAEKLPSLHNDPELSPHGLLQAAHIWDYLKERQLPMPTQIMCSPRVRTQQTLQPLAQGLRLPVQINEALEEKSSLETALEFETRVEKVLSHLKENQIHCLCTHYDWVIVASQLLLSQKFVHVGVCHHWQPCQIVLFDVKESAGNILDFGVVTA